MRFVNFMIKEHDERGTLDFAPPPTAAALLRKTSKNKWTNLKSR